MVEREGARVPPEGMPLPEALDAQMLVSGAPPRRWRFRGDADVLVDERRGGDRRRGTPDVGARFYWRQLAGRWRAKCHTRRIRPARR